MTSSLKLEVGKTYRDRRGNVYGPLRHDGTSGPYRFDAGNLVDCWTPEGRFDVRTESPRDLVEEVCDPDYAPTPHLVSAARRPGGGVVLFTDGKIAFEITDAHATHLIARIAQAIVS